VLETPEAPDFTPYQKFLAATPLSICNPANMFAKANGPRLTKAYARLVGRHKIKCHAVWHYCPSIVTNYSIYHEFCSLILNFVFMCTTLF